MGNFFLDLTDGDILLPLSDNVNFGLDGGLSMMMGKNLAMDFDTGDLHLVTPVPIDDDEDEDEDE